MIGLLKRKEVLDRLEGFEASAEQSRRLGQSLMVIADLIDDEVKDARVWLAWSRLDEVDDCLTQIMAMFDPLGEGGK